MNFNLIIRQTQLFNQRIVHAIYIINQVSLKIFNIFEISDFWKFPTTVKKSTSREKRDTHQLLTKTAAL